MDCFLSIMQAIAGILMIVKSCIDCLKSYFDYKQNEKKKAANSTKVQPSKQKHRRN